MKKSTKVSLALAPAISILIAAVVWVQIVKPWLLNFLTAQIPKINESQSLVDINVGKIDFSLIRLRGYVYNTEIKLKKDTANSLVIPRVTLQLDPFDILIGKLFLSYIRLDSLNAKLNDSVFHLTPKSNDKEINLEPLFKLLPQIPVAKIISNNTNLEINSTEYNINTKSTINYLAITNQKKSLTINLNNSAHELERKFEQRQISAKISASLVAELQTNRLQLTNLKLENEQSQIFILGTINNFKHVLTKPVYDIKTNGRIVFENLKNFLYFTNPSSKRMPQIIGQMLFQSQVTGENFNKNRGTIKLETENVQLDYIKFGNANININLKNNDLSFTEIKMDHPAAQVQLSNFEISQEKPYRFKSKVLVDKFNLQKMFLSLELKNIPTDLDATASNQCSGQLLPFSAQCDSTINIQNAIVKTDVKNKNSIVELEKAQIQGQFTIDTTQFKYTATANINQSALTSDGLVKFSEGFNLNFKSNGLNLGDIKNLANLNLRGSLSGDLNTYGDSSHGIINAKLNAKNFIIDRFKLGQLTTEFDYQNGEMTLANLLGTVEDSPYDGYLNLNFNDSSVQGKINLDKLYGKSILFILQDRFHLPFGLTGTGKAQMSFNGPLDFWKLKYNLSAQLNRGEIAQESFTNINLDLTANGDVIKFNTATLSKPSGQVIVSGLIDTTHTPTLNLDVQTKNIKIEEVDHLAAILPKSSGYLNLNAKVSDAVENAELNGLVSIKELFINAQSMPSSQGEIKINRHFLRYTGQFFGRQVQTSLQIPFSSEYSFYNKAQLRDFNILVALPLIKIPVPSADTQLPITADIDIESKHIDLSDLHGRIDLQSMNLQRGQTNIKLQKPAEIILQSGLKSITPIHLKGQEQELLISQNKDIVTFKGNLNLRMFQFLTPFIENLNGNLEINFGVNSRASKLSLAGDGAVKNALVQIKGFPYPLKEINADLDFSQSKLIISSIKALLNQSQISGQGSLNFISSNNIDVNINADSTRVDLEFPPQMQTSGFIKAKVSGQWLPYTLKIDYTIDQGFIFKEFTEADDNIKFTLPASQYLPPQKLTQQAPTLLLDVNAKFNKGIVIKNQIIEGSATGDIKVQGSPEAPIITGRVDIQNGSKLIFKDKPFDIQTGFVLFNPNNGTSSEVNPDIFMNATSRVSDYDITLLISGQAKNLSIKPTSQPPLSENDIFSLLALGFTSSTQDQNLTSDTQQKQTSLEVIAAISNQSKLNKQIQQKLGLNVQIAPSVDSTKNIAVPKVVVSKKLGKKINASYARPLTGTQQSNEVKLQWLFRPDFSLNLNYQNQTDSQELNIIENNQNDQGTYGVDLEYKKEFK